jgi:hypothetical protein
MSNPGFAMSPARPNRSGGDTGFIEFLSQKIVFIDFF